jgi:hypothetical protein
MYPCTRPMDLDNTDVKDKELNALPCSSAVLARYQRARGSSTIGKSGGTFQARRFKAMRSTAPTGQRIAARANHAT